jgi:hypothetical protein
MFCKSILSLVLSCLVVSITNFGSVYSLTNTKAKVCTVVATLATGAAVGGLTALAVKDANWQKQNKVITAVAASAVGLGLGYLMWDAIFSKYTPMNRILAAEAAVFMAQQDTLISMPFEDIDSFVAHVNVRFGTSYPLVLAREQLLAKATDLGFVLSMVYSAIRDSSGTNEAYEVARRGKVLEAKLPALTNVIEQKVRILVTMPEYKDQMIVYEKHLEAELQRQFEHRERWADRITTLEAASIKVRASKPVVVINNGR